MGPQQHQASRTYRTLTRLRAPSHSTRMFALLALALLVAPAVSSEVQSRLLSFSGEFGGGAGTAFSSSGIHSSGPITALRVWENTGYILGIQMRFGSQWSPIYGSSSGTYQEVALHSREYITQVSGKHNSYITELIFLTNQGRMFRFGQPSGTSFNSFPLHKNTILRFISGRTYSIYLSSIGFHWDQARGNGFSK